jgi:hypothetical protein
LDPPDRLNHTYHRPPKREKNHIEHEQDRNEQNARENQEDFHITTPSHPHTNLPHSSVRLVKKNSSLSTISKARKKHKVEEFNKSDVPLTSRSHRGSGRIGASPMVEMNVASNENALILGSMGEVDGGLELEWGVTV